MGSSGLTEAVRLLVGSKVDDVERALVDHLHDCPPYLRDAAVSMLRRGGKRLRPYLHLVTAELLGYEGDDDILFASVVEYLHVASLVHDDVIDGASMRRGSPTLNEEIGNTRSVLVGDYLCVKALGLAAQPCRKDLLDLIVRATLDLIEGESMQEAMVGRLDVTEDECFRSIELKTGRLIASACEAAALLAGAGDDARAQLREYGTQLGLAFQLQDDILDFVSDAATLGKPVLNDLTEGKLSLPAVRALREGGEAARRVIAPVIEDRGFARVAPSEVLRVVAEFGGIESVEQEAASAAARARESLRGLPAGAPLDALLFATEYAVTRKF